MATLDDLFNQLGRWKHIIILDLYNAFYQNHMHTEHQEGINTKIQDDIIIWGYTQIETAHNYIQILYKLDLANLHVEPQKVIIFPEYEDIAGWIWKKGGLLSVSPHRKNSLMNMREHNNTKVKHMRSFLGLYETLQMATPGVSRVLAPLEEAVVGKNSNDPLEWNEQIS